MDKNRKIIIPIGGDPESKSGPGFFDTQARKDARPVVPLSGESTKGPKTAGTRSRKWTLLVVFLVVAVVAGGTAGAYTYMTRSREKAGPQASVQPVATKSFSTLPWTHTPEDPDAEQSENADDNDENDSNEKASDARTDQGDSKKANKQQKRGKPGKKNADDDPDNPVKRTQDELQRIREIFEGPP